MEGVIQGWALIRINTVTRSGGIICTEYRCSNVLKEIMCNSCFSCASMASYGCSGKLGECLRN